MLLLLFLLLTLLFLSLKGLILGQRSRGFSVHSAIHFGLLNKAALWPMAFGLVALHKLDISVCNFDHNRLFCVI